MLPLHSAAIGLAILSTNGMLWWRAPLTAAEIALLIAAGAAAGVLGFMLMRASVARLAGSR